MGYWLLKSEPDSFSIDDLARSKQQVTAWEGVRNYQARNLIRDKIQLGDEAFFYHSSCAEPGIVGIVQVIRTAYPDASAFDPLSPYYDPKSTSSAPRWFVVDVKLKHRYAVPVLLSDLRSHEALRDMVVLRRGNRLSVMPVTSAEWRYIQNHWRR